MERGRSVRRDRGLFTMHDMDRKISSYVVTERVI